MSTYTISKILMYNAEQSITLNTGFNADNNTVFRAEIGCK
jgi:hypothetical protein